MLSLLFFVVVVPTAVVSLSLSLFFFFLLFLFVLFRFVVSFANTVVTCVVQVHAVPCS